MKVTRDFSFPSTTTQRLRRQGGGEFWTVGHRVVEWIELNCVLTAARFAGRPFKLLPWQVRYLYELFEVVPDGQGGWLLKHRWCLLGIPKKNGKSELAAALALFFLFGTDEVDPRIFVAASTEDQADMVFRPTKFMAENSERLSPMADPKTKMIVSKTSRGGFIRRLAAVGGANDGANVYVAVIDEFHEWLGTKGEDVWNVITNGIVMREEPMIIHITTAGYDQESLCYEWYENGVAVRDGTREDETFYFCWFEAPEDLDWKSEEYISRSNPSYGKIMDWNFYKDQLNKKTESVYRRYFGNQWTESEEIWDAAQVWDDLVGEPNLDPSLRTYCGIDVGRKIDSAVLTIVQFDPENRIANVSQRIWSNPYGKGDPRRAEWRFNIFDMDDAVREIAGRFTAPSGYDEEERERIAGPVFAYDPHLYGSHADALADEGINMQEFPQTDSHMVPASQLLYEWIMGRRIVHDGDPQARRHIRSVVAKMKDRGWRISRPVGLSHHIDFAVALAQAIRVMVVNEQIEDDEEWTEETVAIF